jgi:cobalt-zinc-cadmium resistance protein CzcA
MGVEISDTYILLREKETWRYRSKEELVQAIGKTLDRAVPGAIFSFSQPIELRVSELISGVRSDVAAHVYGDDLAVLKTKADEIAAVLSRVRGAADVKAEQTQGLPMLRVAVDRQAVARYGVNVEQVLDVIEAVGGRSVGVVLEGQMRFALQVRFAPETRHDPDRIRDLRVAVPTPGGDGKRLIPLGQLADIRIEDGPAQISRDRVSRRINVEANVRGRDLGSFVAEAQKAVASEVELPAGWSLEWGGQFENLQEASRRLALLVPLALLLIFVLLYSAFGSVRLALLIYCNVPLAVTGGLLALALRGYPFSISAGVGFIALFGVAVLNGVVLVSYAVERQRDGVAAPQAALEAARVRLRPVLMTALVAALGFVPMALSGGAGAEVQRPLATVVIGGIVSTTLLTLLVLPSIYPWFSGSPADAAAVDRS